MNTVKTLLFAAAVTLSASSLTAQQAKLSAADIVNKNIQARGGLQAWHSVQTLKFIGKMQAGSGDQTRIQVNRKKGDKVVPDHATSEQVELPFVLELKRNRKMRVEIEFDGKTAIQLYDGVHGWKYRPYLNRTDYQPYSEEEVKASSQQQDLDGPLVDYAAKGSTVEFLGNEKVDGKDTYKIQVQMKDGHSQKIWIDAQTFLEAKVEGTPRKMDGSYRPVEIYYRDYRRVNGIMLPALMETHLLPGPPVRGRVMPAQIEKMTITTIEVNPKLDDALFTKPVTEVANNAPHDSSAKTTKHP